MRKTFEQEIIIAIDSLDIEETEHWSTEEFALAGARAALQSKLVTAMADSLTELLDAYADDCYFDHNGNCQAHACFGGEGTCFVTDARKALLDFEAARAKGE